MEPGCYEKQITNFDHRDTLQCSRDDNPAQNTTGLYGILLQQEFV